MRRSFTRGPFSPRLLIATTVVTLLLGDRAWAQERQKQVLVLYSTRQDSQIVIVGDRELQRILGKGLPGGIDYYTEHIDQARFSHAEYEVAFRDSLRLKYEHHRFDVVIAMGDVPLDFVDRNRDALFADAPVVFFSHQPWTRRMTDATGVTVEQNFSGTLALAAALQPDLRHVFIVTGTPGSFVEELRRQLRPFESRFSFTYLSGLETKDLDARLASLPAHSAVYYLTVDRDGDQNFRPLDYLVRVTSTATAPVYSWVDSAMDHGIIGGHLKDQTVQVRAIGAIALRVLRGERADSIPMSSPNLYSNQIDWRQLQRWGISEARVPAGTLIRFREPSAWERYKIYILSAVFAILAQASLIAGLLLQRSRRRQAERKMRDSQDALRATYERNRALASRLLHAQENERARIARELHDDISQQMALLEMDLTVLGTAVHGDAEGLATEVLSRAKGIGKTVHDLSHRLHPAKLRLIGLVPALHGLQRELSQSGIVVSVSDDNVPSTLPPDLTLCLFRIVQEALQNAIRYSGAHAVSVRLSGDAEHLVLVIDDDGRGFDVSAAWGKGLGLISMGERVDAIGGTFKIQSTPGAGTRLEVNVPLAIERDSSSIAV